MSVIRVGGRAFAAGLYWLERGGPGATARTARRLGRPWWVHHGERTGFAVDDPAETLVPETLVPETLVPETLVPETLVPEAACRRWRWRCSGRSRARSGWRWSRATRTRPAAAATRW